MGFKPDQRDYGIGVQILREIGVRSMRLLSNNPRKLVAIEGYGLSVSEWLPLEIPPSPSSLTISPPNATSSGTCYADSRLESCEAGSTLGFATLADIDLARPSALERFIHFGPAVDVGRNPVASLNRPERLHENIDHPVGGEKNPFVSPS